MKQHSISKSAILRTVPFLFAIALLTACGGGATGAGGEEEHHDEHGEEHGPEVALNADQIKAIGFDAVEVPIFNTSDLAPYERLGKRLQFLGLSATAVTVMSPETNPISPDPAPRCAWPCSPSHWRTCRSRGRPSFGRSSRSATRCPEESSAGSCVGPRRLEEHRIPSVVCDSLARTDRTGAQAV